MTPPRTLAARLWRNFARVAVAALAAVALAAAAPTAAAQAPAIKLTENNIVEANGDCRFSYEIRLSAFKYTELKKKTPNMKVLLRRFGLNQENWYAVEGVRGSWDDGTSTVKIEFTTRGVARAGRDLFWEIPIFEGVETELVAVTNHSAVLTSAANLPEYGLATSTVRVMLPPGAEQVKLLKSPARLAYRLPAPSLGGEPRAEFDFDTQPQVMTSLAKVMSNRKFSALWTAKAVFRNTGTQSLRDYKARFRMTDYSTAWSPWSGTPIVVPGQTVIDPYFPILDMDKITRITSTTRAAIEVQFQYRRADGQLVEESDTRELDLLSRNHVFYSNLPRSERISWHDTSNLSDAILPAFVSHHDPVIQQAAGWVCQQIGGANAASNDENAVKFMRAAYDFMAANVVYQTPPWEDGIQHVKYGRDVLRNRAGTCIDLAILYASLCEAVGLEPVLYMVPEHCFPAVVLPGSGKVLPVEATAIGKGSFEDAVKHAVEKRITPIEQGSMPAYPVDIAKMHKLGVQPIDLPPLGPDALEKWGIKLAGSNPGWTTGQQGRRSEDDRPQPNANCPLVGKWLATVEGNGERVMQLIRFNADGTYVTVTDRSTGVSDRVTGTWTCHGDTRVTIRPQGRPAQTGTVDWVNNDRFEFTLSGGMTFTYDRQ